MAYAADIGRDNPICLLFVIDQSDAMSARTHSGLTKAELVADAINKTLYTLMINCTKLDGVHDYVHVGAIGYGGRGAGPGFGGDLSGSIVHPISAIAAAPLRLAAQSTREQADAGSVFGGALEHRAQVPVWLEAISSGGAPMGAALTKASEALVNWCSRRPRSYPPTVLHLTDGASTDGDPEPKAAALRQIATDDGACLLFNLHVSALPGEAIRLPDSASALPNPTARLLFGMSSGLPPHAVRVANDKGYRIGPDARGFVFNAIAADVVDFFECVAPRFWMLRARMTPGQRLHG
jgi:hypothetical protein